MTENALSILIVIFFCTTTTNRDLREKAVCFPAWPACMISIPAGKIVENEKSIYNTVFFYLNFYI